MKKPSPRKVLLSTPPVLNHSVPFISPVIKTFAPENIKTPPTTEPAPQAKASDTSTSETPVNNSTEENFDSAAALSDLEDISPERESEPDEDPSDPFSDFVPEEQKEEEKISKDPEVKEPEYENFSPEPPVFDDPPEEPEASEQPKELSKDLAEPQFSTVKEQLQEEIQSLVRHSKNKKEKKKKKDKKRKKDKRRTSSRDESDLVGSPISSGPDNTVDSPLAASPISSGDDNFEPVISPPYKSDKNPRHFNYSSPHPKVREEPVKRGPRTPPLSPVGPRTPPRPKTGPRTPPPVLTGPRTPPDLPRSPVGPKTPPEPADYSPGSEGSSMSDRRYSTKSRYGHSDRSPESDRRYDRDRRRSDTPEGQDARGLTPELDRRRERSPPPNGNKRRRDSDWDSVEPKRRKSRDRSRDRKRDRRSRERSPYRDRSPRDRSLPRSPPYRDRSRSPGGRDRSQRSYRSRTRSRSRSPKRSDRSRKKDNAIQDTSLFAEMRKKKHLREKLDAKKISKRDDFEENVIETRKSTSSSEKGNFFCNLFICLICLITRASTSACERCHTTLT